MIPQSSYDLSTWAGRTQYLVDHHANGNMSEFGRLTGTNETTVRNYCTGRTPKGDFITRVALAFPQYGSWWTTGNNKGEYKIPEENFLANVAEEPPEMLRDDLMSFFTMDFMETKKEGTADVSLYAEAGTYARTRTKQMLELFEKYR